MTATDRARAAIADADQQLRGLITSACESGAITEGLADQLGHDAGVLTATAIGEVTRAAAAERERLAADPVAAHVREFLSSDDLTELVRAEPPCSRDDAMTAIGGLIGVSRMLLKLIEGESP